MAKTYYKIEMEAQRAITEIYRYKDGEQKGI